jgi:uncharacterized protein (DUF4213/DUF364 family)
MITNKVIFDTLLSEIQDQKIKRVIIGFNWTLVETKYGCGLASTPGRENTLCVPILGAGHLTKLTTTSASELVHSKNPIEVSIGMATINSFYNRYDLVAKNKNGLDTFLEADGHITVIGRFPGLSKRFKNISIIEKNPRKGEYSENDAAGLLSNSASVIITSSTLLNGTAANLIQLSKNARICLVGPSTPLAPKLLNLGIECLAGTIVTDIKKMIVAVSQGGNVKTLKPFGSFKVISR